jgi:arylformamidase
MNLEAEYDNRARVPGHPAIVAAWQHDAAAFRKTAKGEIDLAYGAGERNRLDLFMPKETGQNPLILFIHGGYWRAFDKSSFSHMAAGALAHGLAVAVPSYTLCPNVRVPDIVDELRQCCLFLWHRLQRPMVVSGHSAGGHLAAAMAATNWQDLGAPPTLIRACLTVSGLFDLRPLLATSINNDIRLSVADAQIASPLLWSPPKDVVVDAWVGSEESSEFLRQSMSLIAAWRGVGLDAHYTEVENANHFSVINALIDPRSVMTQRLVELAQCCAADRA